MVLGRILLTRHGRRTNWPGEQSRPGTESTFPDTPLSIQGEKQADELADYLMTLSPPVDIVISSPFVRCLQTMEPFTARRSLEIWPEPGLGEWYGMKPADPAPAPTELLQNLFPGISTAYDPIESPNPEGESIVELHDRCERVLSAMIRRLDEHPDQPSSVLVCTHAATFVGLCRALGGNRPQDPTTVDFVPYTSCITAFERSSLSAESTSPTPKGGDWVCKTNGDCSFLSLGKQRGWRFSGKESYGAKVPGHGVDAGTGLGVIVVD